MARTKTFKLPAEFTSKETGKRNINAQINIHLYNTVKAVAETEGKNMTEIITQMFADYIEKNRTKAEELTNFKFS